MKKNKFYLIVLSKFLKKGGSSLERSPFFIGFFSSLFIVNILSSCTISDSSQYGQVSFYNTGESKSFIFTVSEEFIKKNQNSAVNEYNPKITNAEADLLEALLKNNDYCQSEKSPQYVITSKQEKIFDMTFAHLIEENYNAKPIVPRTYFGRCR